MRRIFTGSVLAVGLIIALAACSPTQPETVEVTLTEYGVESPVTTFKVGQSYRFVITNQGEISHEFVIMRPLGEGEVAMADHGMKDALVEITEDKLPPGATVTVDYIFTEPMTPGDLEFACHVSGHYAAGMKMPITVAP